MPGSGGPGEFDIIARYLAPLSAAAPGAFNLKDDAAVVKVPDGDELIVTTDAMIEGVHFLAKDGPERIARKLLRVNLSDLAAKGAHPIGYQLILGLPGAPDEDWISRFCDGLRRDQETFGCPLYGGDTVRSPGGITLGITAFGSMAAGTMLRRSGARVGDDLYVTGSIGDAALGLETKLNHRLFSSAMMMFFDARLHLPTPRMAMGRGLPGLAHAALDVSDGLVQDAGHIAAASGLQLTIDAGSVPLSLATRQAVQDDPDLLDVVLTGGDDYELLFAAPPGKAAAVAELSRKVGLAANRIGRFGAGEGTTVIDQYGNLLKLSRRGYQHFGGS
ncbi:MAG: thiamine-phosphate kinase [Ferrovibrio sp.]